MNEARAVPARPAIGGWPLRHPAWCVGALCLAAAALSLDALAARLPPALWIRATLSPDLADMRQVVVRESFLPRLVVSLLCGAALGLAGTIFQHVLRNPLASSTTLGVSAGAKVALAVVGLWLPALLEEGGEWVALAGSTAAFLLVLGIASNRGLAPLSVVLAGMAVSFAASTGAAALMLFNEHYLTGLFLWGGGSLSQQDWSAVLFLAPRLAAAALLAGLMIRPLSLMGLGDVQARSLGLGLGWARLVLLATAVTVAASVVSAVGVIGFVDLAAPTLVGLLGARRLQDRLVWAPLAGAALLWLTDQLVLRWSGIYGEMVPTGAVTALLGAPLLLFLLPRLAVAAAPPRGALTPPARAARRPWTLTGTFAAIAVLALAAALAVGRGPDGVTVSGPSDIAALLPWRAPRLAAAFAAGAMLAAAGVLMQRLTANAMASPEVLGISTGAALGLLALLLLVPGAGRAITVPAGAAGAFLALAAILSLARSSAFSPERVLIAGIALGAFFDALVVALMAAGDPRAQMLLNWLVGSTYRVSATDAFATAGIAAGLLATLPLLARWLDILPLGAGTARALGVSLGASRLAVLLFAAVATATATLVIGPLSFVGLVSPHLARLAGLARGLPQAVGAALIGGTVMAEADWLGRMLSSTSAMPAGLMAALVGTPCLLWLLRRR
ncbi:Fe(3+)-hydroxamate ABC transporter permease FhuB [Chelatococcus sp. SYSU_G07232]|uniref:Fe(3+)-hydroxamate ABC transporter permease FhuB n=1 Tax=Chelatococcus albus TaxID=3047466 RepID=A0ABT7ABD2_9HYPH|nr:Fe(3+)-hydroxamate ABC transporter permease FhuB [Chelatococcus sp. SYSU_G07232]MDJ1156678.1 Fe(3+)-hydroxamate ABC transporter permease FhuB [Chelatococcus sp. SYSU_G07232]